VKKKLKRPPTKGSLTKGKQPRVPAAKRCKGHTTQEKRPCKNAKIKGGVVCPAHGGSAPQVKRKAKERIREYVAEMVDPDRVLQEAARLAFSDLRQCFDENGKVKDTKDWPDELAAAVSSTKSRRVNLDSADGHTDVVTELKVWDKPKNIELLMKHLGLLTEKVELKVEGDIVARLHEARKRLADGKPR